MSAPPATVSVVTTETIAGYRIVRTLGYVEGAAPGSQPTSQPILAMIQQAQGRGANAVVAVRWSHGTVGQLSSGSGSIYPFGLVYGTAVLIESEAGSA